MIKGGRTTKSFKAPELRDLSPQFYDRTDIDEKVKKFSADAPLKYEKFNADAPLFKAKCGGKVKKMASGGTVRGAGCVKRGVKKCKVR